MPDIAPDRLRWLRLFELSAVVVFWLFGIRFLVWAMAQLGAPLPEIPLLKQAYLFAAFAVLLAVWVWARGEDLAEFGLVAPKRPLVLIGRGLIVLAAILLLDIVVIPNLDPIVAQLTGGKPNLGVQHFASLKGNLGLLLYLVPCAWLFGGFGEEFVFRGYVMTRVAQILGAGRAAWAVALVLQAIPFALGHLYQGPVGMVGVFLLALVQGIGAIAWGRNLWPTMFAHGAFDSLSFLALYLGAVQG